MLQKGKYITQTEDLLTGFSPEELFLAVKNPEQEVLSLIERMRRIGSIDKKQYGLVKRQLPYIVCGVFNPPCRKIENFGYCEYFMMDIDHISEKNLSMMEVKRRLMDDARVLMCFVSPSEDGLKVLFRLSERCHDAGKYTLFYKRFVEALSQQYALEQAIDARTSDVSRACFLSYDPDVYFNPRAEAVEMKAFIDFDNPFEYIEYNQNKRKGEVPDPEKPEGPKHGPDEEALEFIKGKLNARKGRLANKPKVYIPEQLEQILEELLTYIGEAGIIVEEVVDIHYGKKFKMKAGMSLAEVNLFFGKKGFSVVKSPRQGTSDQLNELIVEYIKAFIEDYVLLKENTALNISHGDLAEGRISESEIIRQQGKLLFLDKNYREALPLYRALWNGSSEECNKWDSWHYAYCALKLKDYSTALSVCRKVYDKHQDFQMLNNVYAWSIYYSEISKERIDDETTFFRAGNGIMRLSRQDDKYSPYTQTVFKILDYLNGRNGYPTEKILEWTDKLNPAILDREPYSFTDREGKLREIASKQEQYYMYRCRALQEKGNWNECIRLSEEALKNIKTLHYGNDVWFRWRIALSYEGLGEFQKSLDLQLALLMHKKEWFIQKEIAEQYFRLGDYEKALQYAIDGALNYGDTDKKINLFIVLKNSLEKLGKTDEAKLHSDLIEIIKRRNDPGDDLKKLKRVWNAIKMDGKERLSGVIDAILPNGKAGFVKADNGKKHYFSIRDFKANPSKAVAGTRVTFYLEEGFDKKKNMKTMNATKMEIMNKSNDRK